MISTAARCELAADIDAPVVARYCQAWSSWKRAEEFLHARGETSTVRSLVSGRSVVVQWPHAAHALRLAHTAIQDTTFSGQKVGGTARDAASVGWEVVCHARRPLVGSHGQRGWPPPCNSPLEGKSQDITFLKAER